MPSSRLPAGARITSDGIRYSNIDPDHEISAAPCATGISAAAEMEPVAGGNIALGDGEETRQPRFRRQKIVAIGIERAFGREAADRKQIALAVDEKAEVHGQRHRARLVLQPLQPQSQGSGLFDVACKIVAMGRDGVHAGLRPEQHVEADFVVALRGQRPCDIGHRVGLSGELFETRPQIVRRRKRLARGDRQRGQGIVELAPRDRLRLAAVPQALSLFPRQVEGVGDPGEAGCGAWVSAGLCALPFAAGVGERDEVAGEVSAVDRRDIFRIEGAQVAGVVPIVEMPPVTGHAAHGRERRLKSVDHLSRSEPAEIMGARQREKIQADIGRRGAMGHAGRRGFLKIVGRQHVVAAGDEGLEKAPGAAGGQPQGLRVVFGERRAAGAARRQAHPARDRGRSQPERREDARQREVSRSADPAEGQGQRGEDQCAEHAAIGGGQVEPPRAGRLRRGHPFEQILVAHIEAVERANNRIAHQPGLMAQENEGERGQDEREFEIAADGAEMARRAHAGLSRRHGGDHRNHRRQRDRRDHESGPDQSGVERHEPACEQGQDREGRRQGATQVVEHFPAPDRRKGGGRFGRVPVVGAATENRGQQLPVAARPAMMAQRADIVALLLLAEFVFVPR